MIRALVAVWLAGLVLALALACTPSRPTRPIDDRGEASSQ